MNSSSLNKSRRPVFVLGSPRSGTTLLYHMLLSAGNFAVYRTESNVFNLLMPRFGNLSVRSNRQALMKVWLGSKLFTRSELEAAEIEQKVVSDCRSYGDFLRVVMGEIARKQGVERWADCTPDHLLYLSVIKREIPEALVVHIVRDGRDVALSLDKQRWIRPFPWDRDKGVLVAGLYWQWMVNKGRENGRMLGADYTEIHFEDLIQNPRPVLAKLGEFLDHDLDYDRILKVGIGSVSDPNTSFQPGSDDKKKFNPVGRWRDHFSSEQLAGFESLMGGTLESLGYELATKGIEHGKFGWKGMRTPYENMYSAKLWFKQNTPLGKILISDDLSWL
ncbi:MAG: sulfotransferase [Candidatus Sulfotelmatobacter sp.]